MNRYLAAALGLLLFLIADSATAQWMMGPWSGGGMMGGLWGGRRLDRDARCYRTGSGVRPGVSGLLFARHRGSRRRRSVLWLLHDSRPQGR